MIFGYPKPPYLDCTLFDLGSDSSSTAKKKERDFLKQDVDIVVGGTQAVDGRVRVHRLLAPQQAEEPHGRAYRVQAH